MADEKSKVSYPMIPESNWWGIRSQFNKTLPSVVSVNYLKTLLGLTTDQAAKNLMSPLKSLGILEEDGSPTELANLWRTDSTYAQACEAMLMSTYPQELLDLFPDKNYDRIKVKEWFKTTGKLGESAASKAVSLFALLKSGEIKAASGTTQGNAKKPKAVKQAKPKTSHPLSKGGTKENLDGILPNSYTANTNNSPQMAIHIDLQIHISPEASAEQIDAIFASMAKHLYK